MRSKINFQNNNQFKKEREGDGLVKLFLPDFLNGYQIHPILYGQFLNKIPNNKKEFLKSRINQFHYNIEIVNEISESDLVLVPVFFSQINSEIKKYLDYWVDISEKNNKKIIISFFGDMVSDIHYSKGVILKNSVWKSDLRGNEIVVPAFSEDLLIESIFNNKRKKPVIGFCGQTELLFKNYIKNKIKNLLFNILFFITQQKKFLYKKRGVSLRKKLIEILKKDKSVTANFIERNFFSGSSKTAVGDINKLKKDFYENIIESDFVLSPKGDGNYSNRFFETLSCGRVPIVVDTDIYLSGFNKGELDKFVVMVPYNQKHKVSDFIKDFYSKHDNKSWVRLQEEIIEKYKKDIRYDSFMNKLLRDLLSSN
jgi:hypothetical protein